MANTTRRTDVPDHLPKYDARIDLLVFERKEASQEIRLSPGDCADSDMSTSSVNDALSQMNMRLFAAFEILF
jgi:hypothetical protein